MINFIPNDTNIMKGIPQCELESEELEIEVI